LEIIAVDDCSTDETPTILSEYAARDSRIQIVTHVKNTGLPGALNTGFSRAGGEFLTWIGDDDRYAPNALEIMSVAFHGRPRVGVVCAGYVIVDDQDREIGKNPARPPEELPYWNTVGTCFLFRREVWLTLGGYSDTRPLVEDYDFWLRASQHFEILALDEYLKYYRTHPASLSRSRQREVQLQAHDLLREFMESAGWGPRERALSSLRFARDAGAAGDRRQAARDLWKALRLYPKCMGARFAFGAVAYLLLGRWTDRVKTRPGRIL
jgi:hypothetical protein